eukprot:TRINITY_DN31555_c0_g2_i1.p1 TRINITY_DN31555_c0_g2~~TRINITY_DN31555_c0_g2_i1.p1  ORF type:complete len:476 (-),score=40.22 TRINITY_DN31555_c0_g2_i1:49-1476(-)
MGQHVEKGFAEVSREISRSIQETQAVVLENATFSHEVMFRSVPHFRTENALPIGRLWRLKLLGFCGAGLYAAFCVAFPFGEPFRKGGDNSIRANWAYYFVYNVFGWGGLWIKILLIWCWLWEQPHFLPFLKGDPGWFQLNKSFAAFLLAECFSTAVFLLGYGIWEDPVPLGTISFGVTCILFCFLCIYFFHCPEAAQADIRRPLRSLLYTLLPFFLWLVALVGYTCLVWITREVILTWRDGTVHGEVWFNAGMMSVHSLFLCIRGFFCYGTEEQFIGIISKEMGTLWRFAYKAQMTCFTMWMYPILNSGMWITPLLSSLLGTSVLAANLYWIEMASYSVADELIKIAFCILADMFAAANFLVIFTSVGVGPNKKYMYIIEDLTDEQVLAGVLKMTCVIAGKTVEAFALWNLARRRFEERHIQHVRNFFIVCLNDWYWIIWCILMSSSLVCGTCMVMKHDGMDVSLKFSEWSGVAT